ncbi:MAG: RecX family transcriptional regulator [Bacilli bacterium]|nr:RecX family transcriptional regulator [Bacilli bacterium]
MKIKGIKKLSNNKYNIIFNDDSNLTVYEDVIIKYNLLSDKELNNDLLKQIEKDNSYAECYNKALKYISIRLRSEFEVSKYLKGLNINEKIITQTITKLKEQGYLNDGRFIKAFINDKINMTSWGPYKIIRELEKNGVKYMGEISSIISNDLLGERVQKIIKKMVSSNKSNSTNMLKNKILGYLINIGYSREQVINYIENIQIDDEESRFKKEYQKLYNKYKSKYKDEELVKVIRNKLYQKGFNYNDFL